ncbi:MAG: hypothetical protein EAX81_02550 [Candidatus Thorarchaeota archaeon]|nr:hypothetical protein [Candidatus Thorarchaeota archaeon]
MGPKAVAKEMTSQCNVTFRQKRPILREGETLSPLLFLSPFWEYHISVETDYHTVKDHGNSEKFRNGLRYETGFQILIRSAPKIMMNPSSIPRIRSHLGAYEQVFGFDIPNLQDGYSFFINSATTYKLVAC